MWSDCRRFSSCSSVLRGHSLDCVAELITAGRFLAAALLRAADHWENVTEQTNSCRKEECVICDFKIIVTKMI